MSSTKLRKICCIDCGSWCGSGRKYCKPCRQKKKQELKEQCINSKKSDAIYSNGHISNRYAKIRYHARHDYEKIITKCQKCGYDKHVEICHIKSIKEFDSTLKKISLGMTQTEFQVEVGRLEVLGELLIKNKKD